MVEMIIAVMFCIVKVIRKGNSSLICIISMGMMVVAYIVMFDIQMCCLIVFSNYMHAKLCIV